MPTMIQRRVKLQKTRIVNNLQHQILTTWLAPIKGLVFSGCGAKCIAYTGFLKQLECSPYLDIISHVSGSSSGALIATMVSLGMSAKDLEYIVSFMDIQQLRENHFFPSDGKRFEYFIELVLYHQIKNVCHQEKIDSLPLIKKLTLIEQQLSYKGLNISCLADILALNDDAYDRIATVFDAIPLELRLTFLDIHQLKQALPQGKQILIKELHIALHDLGKKDTLICNAQNTPFYPLAKSVCASAAHPALFKPIAITGQLYNDGGILNNMPVEPLLDAGLDAEEILCLKAESAVDLANRLEKITRSHLETVESYAQQFIDTITEFLFQAKAYLCSANNINKEKIFYTLQNMLYLSSEDVEVNTSHIPAKTIQKVIQKSKADTQQFFTQRKIFFSHPLIGYLYLDHFQLEQLVKNHETSSHAQDALIILEAQERIVEAIQNKRFEEISHYFQIILQRHIPNNLKQAVLFVCAEQINFLTHGQFEDFLNEHYNTSVGLFEKIWRWLISIFTSSKEYLPSLRELSENYTHSLSNHCLFGNQTNIKFTNLQQNEKSLSFP
jgi:VPS inhibitor protein D